MRKLNSGKNHRKAKESGNVLIYVLIGIILIGALTVTLSRQANQADSENLDKETIQFNVLQLMEYAQSMQNVVSQMEMTGTTFSTIDIVNPTSNTPYTTAPHIHKIYHPQGGGMTYKTADDYSSGVFLSTTDGWQLNNANNVEWTESSADDLILTAMDINEDICNGINAKIRDDISTPPVSTATIDDLFLEGATTDLTATNCADCEGYQTLCLEDSAGDYAFYSVLINR
jgi:hypothetical protein